MRQRESNAGRLSRHRNPRLSDRDSAFVLSSPTELQAERVPRRGSSPGRTRALGKGGETLCNVVLQSFREVWWLKTCHCLSAFSGPEFLG